MPGAAPGFGKELSAGYRKNNPGVKETSNTFPKRKNIGRPISDFANTIGEDLGRKGAAQLESKQRAAGKTPLVSAPAKGAASAGRSPGGKRSRKHNIRGG
tara:strand:+ start:1289 stop:1588 length:300 start_codon:yes stop_codon:yes gene_type:complete